MGNYTPGSFTAYQNINPVNLQAEFDAIAAAHNSHATGDFPADCVPVTALVNDQADFEATFGYDGTLSGARLLTAQAKYLVIPVTCTLVSARVIAGTLTDAVSTTNLYHETDAAYLCSSAITLAVAATAYTGTLAKTDFTAGDVISLRVAIAGGNSVTALTWSLRFKAQHTT